MKSALASHATSTDDATAVADLPANNPGNSTNGYLLSGPQARALGFSANFATDDAVTLNSNLTYNWDPNNRNVSGNYDAIGVLEHEISEGVFGRFQNLNTDNNKSNSILDLFRFTTNGTDTRTYSPSADGWFSLDGTHNLERYNNSSVQSGDLADWYPTIAGDSFGNGSTNIPSLVTPVDLRLLDAIGWTRAPATVNDFNANGVSDILFTNASTGDLGFYNMNGTNQGWQHIGAASTAYSIVGTGDFNGDYASDILFRNNATGDMGFYSMSNSGNGTGNNGSNTAGNDLAGTLAGWVHIGASNTSYSVVGVGDFFGTGGSDILFRNNSTGDMGFYYPSSGNYNNWSHIGASSTAYSVVGLGDFYGNGTSDILFRNNSTGDFGFYQMVNGVNQGWVHLGFSATSYTVVGIGDFEGIGNAGAGTSDILFRDNSTGDLGYFTVTNGTLGAWHHVGASSAAYSVVGIGDYYGNGVDDILFRNNTSGDTGFYAMSNGVNIGWHNVGASSPTYSVVNDANSNGVAVGEAPASNSATSLTQTLGGDTSLHMSQTLGGDTSLNLTQTLGGDTSLHMSQTLGGDTTLMSLGGANGGPLPVTSIYEPYGTAPVLLAQTLGGPTALMSLADLGAGAAAVALPAGSSTPLSETLGGVPQVSTSLVPGDERLGG